eukprot:TRINITY_DN8537_c0_g1_i8.p3 TRINITY_DN8537_c0_g1~~TRINITY_DN8537_c0_g1_i8.p3  ORF type:complete len:154 (+),score=5.40 TRINITY_DN8537_c0_g1_i8:67-528(+)
MCIRDSYKPRPLLFCFFGRFGNLPAIRRMTRHRLAKRLRLRVHRLSIRHVLRIIRGGRLRTGLHVLLAAVLRRIGTGYGLREHYSARRCRNSRRRCRCPAAELVAALVAEPDAGVCPGSGERSSMSRSQTNRNNTSRICFHCNICKVSGIQKL